MISCCFFLFLFHLYKKVHPSDKKIPPNKDPIVAPIMADVLNDLLGDDRDGEGDDGEGNDTVSFVG